MIRRAIVAAMLGLSLVACGSDGPDCIEPDIRELTQAVIDAQDPVRKAELLEELRYAMAFTCDGQPRPEGSA